MNGVVWGRARRFLPCFTRPDGTTRPLADVGFILVLATMFYFVLYYVYRLMPPPPTRAEAAAGQWFSAARSVTGAARKSFADVAGHTVGIPPVRYARTHSDELARNDFADAENRYKTHL